MMECEWEGGGGGGERERSFLFFFFIMSATIGTYAYVTISCFPGSSFSHIKAGLSGFSSA